MNAKSKGRDVSIRDLLPMTDADIRQKIDELSSKSMREGSIESDKYGGMSIGMAAKKHVDTALSTPRGDPAAIRLMRVVLAAHRADSSVTPFIDNVRQDLRDLTMAQLHNLLDEMDCEAFSKNRWWHNDKAKFDTLKELVAHFHKLGKEPAQSDEEQLKLWAESFDLDSWKNNPIRQIRGIGLATVQHLRLEFGVDTVKPDTHVLNVLEKEFGAKLSKAKAIRAAEEIAKIAGLRAREIDQIFLKYSSGGYLPNDSQSRNTLEDYASVLERSDDYRVLRRLKPSTTFAETPPNSNLATGVVVDTETTGLDPNSDRIIEVGIIVFQYDPNSGQPIRQVDFYDGLEDPGHPLSEQTKSITGITDDHVANKRFDDERINALVAKADIVIAHNASFDRAFLEKRFPVFVDLPWGCSMADIDWSGERIGSRTLEFLAYKLGFFFDAHRALEDCQALLSILSSKLPLSGIPALKPVIDSLNRVDHTIYATNAPFAKKELLKNRRYQWDSERKCWRKTLIGTAAYDEELSWLRNAVFEEGEARIDVVEVDARLRYASRSQRVTSVSI